MTPSRMAQTTIRTEGSTMPEPVTPDPTTEPPKPTPPAAAAPTTEPADVFSEEHTEAEWKQMARKWERDAKKANAQLEAAAPRLSEYDRLVEASKTDAQRLQEAAQIAQTEAETARSEALRYRVALKHGIAEDDFDFLGTGSEQELEARAERLAAKNAAAAQQPGPRAPARNPAQGSQPAAASDPAQQFASFLQSHLGS